MHWGHAMSLDLIHWEDLDPVLAPDDPHVGCWSGTSLVNPLDENELLIYYTLHTEDLLGRRENVAFATSSNGSSFLNKGLVLTGEDIPEGYSKEDFRDPKIYFENGKYYLLLASNKDSRGCILVYEGAKNLSFSFAFPIFLDEMGVQAECPDYLLIGNNGLLLFSSIMEDGSHKSFYAIGKIDFMKRKYSFRQAGIIDFGSAFYAPEVCSSSSKEHYLIAWMENWKEKYPLIEGHDNWSGGFSLPRSVSIRKGRLEQKIPNSFLDSLGKKEKCLEGELIKKEGLLSFTLLYGGSLTLSDPLDPTSFIFFGLHSGSFYCDLTRLKVGAEGRYYSSKGEVPLKVMMVIDTSSIEIFLGDGEVGSFRFYFEGDSVGLTYSFAQDVSFRRFKK